MHTRIIRFKDLTEEVQFTSLKFGNYSKIILKFDLKCTIMNLTCHSYDKDEEQFKFCLQSL